MNRIIIAVVISLLMNLGCDVQSPIVPEDPMNPQSVSVGKAAEDRPGGGLQGIWLDVYWNSELTKVCIDSLIFTPRDGVTDELDYRFIRMALGEVDESACVVKPEIDIDDYIDCLVQNASEQLELPLEGGRIRIQSDNGRGHIVFDRRIEWFYDQQLVLNERGEVTGETLFHYESNTIEGDAILLDQQVVIWDSLLLLRDVENLHSLFDYWSNYKQFTRSRSTAMN